MLVKISINVSGFRYTWVDPIAHAITNNYPYTQTFRPPTTHNQEWVKALVLPVLYYALERCQAHDIPKDTDF